MKVGLFDYGGEAEGARATLYEERLAFAAAADEAGIYCLHVAEHHCTPLNMVPVPGVYLAAVARATRRMRLHRGCHRRRFEWPWSLRSALARDRSARLRRGAETRKLQGE